MLREALDFPASGDHGAKALVLGAGALALTGGFALAAVIYPPVLIAGLLPLALARGYYVRVLRVASARTESTAPRFDAPVDLLRDGLLATVIAGVYLLPAAILFLLAAGGNLLAGDGTPSVVAIVETFGGLSALFGLLALLGAFYVLPAAVTNFAYKEELVAAFRVRTVFDGAFSEDYAVGWTVTLVGQWLVFPLVLLLQGILVGFFVQFFLGVAVRYIWARSFGAAMGFEPDRVPREGITPASTPRQLAPSSNDLRVDESTSGDGSVTLEQEGIDPAAEVTDTPRGESAAETEPTTEDESPSREEDERTEPTDDDRTARDRR